MQTKTQILKTLKQQGISATMYKIKAAIDALGMTSTRTKFEDAEVERILESFTSPEQQQTEQTYTPATLDTTVDEDAIGTNALAVMSGVDDEINRILRVRRDYVDNRSDTLVNILEETPNLVLAATARKLEERQRQRQSQGMQGLASMFEALAPKQLLLQPYQPAPQPHA